MHRFQSHCTVSKYLLLVCFSSMRELLNQYLGVSDQISVDTYHEIPVLSINLSVLFLSAVEVLLMSHHNHLNPWGSAALLNFAIFSSLLVCTHHLSLPLAAEAGGTAANEWSKDITNTSHQETLQRNLPVPFQ